MLIKKYSLSDCNNENRMISNGYVTDFINEKLIKRIGQKYGICTINCIK